ncbi:MAG: EH signature domain-containing protein [Burkholderiales bacterium]
MRDFSVKHWKNPWLKTNDKTWGRVSNDARQMVAGWLKSKVMDKFFGLLSEDGVNDQRRLKFWLRYVEHVGEMYFALGNNAMHNNSPDFKQLRAEMAGLVLHLYAGGGPANNAFIMRMGSHIVVEFGEKGNACFIFDARKELPFSLKDWVAGDRTELKHDSNVARLLHFNRADSDWEEQFEDELARLVGVKPSRATPGLRPANRLSTSASKPIYPSTNFSQSSFDDLVRHHSLRVGDNRMRGGALWVYVGKQETLVTMQLKKWGFQYNEHKTAWWKGS